MLLASTRLKRLSELGIDAHLHSRRDALGTERGPSDRGPDRLVEVVAAFGLVGQRLDILLRKLCAGEGLDLLHCLASSYRRLYLLRSDIAWITSRPPLGSWMAMTSSGSPCGS